jgi:hypothetical protein
VQQFPVTFQWEEPLGRLATFHLGSNLVFAEGADMVASPSSGVWGHCRKFFCVVLSEQIDWFTCHIVAARTCPFLQETLAHTLIQGVGGSKRK